MGHMSISRKISLYRVGLVLAVTMARRDYVSEEAFSCEADRGSPGDFTVHFWKAKCCVDCETRLRNV